MHSVRRTLVLLVEVVLNVYSRRGSPRMGGAGSRPSGGQHGASPDSGRQHRVPSAKPTSSTTVPAASRRRRADGTVVACADHSMGSTPADEETPIRSK